MQGKCQDCKHWDRNNQQDGSATCLSQRSQNHNTQTFSLYGCNAFERK